MRTENSCGVIPVYKENNISFFLLVRQTNNLWSFPKGHIEEGESPKETALRELKEETGITEIEIIEAEPIMQEYEFKRGEEMIHKINNYFVGFVKSSEVTMQEKEVMDYKWLTFDEANDFFDNNKNEFFTYDSSKEVLKKAEAILNK